MQRTSDSLHYLEVRYLQYALLTTRSALKPPHYLNLSIYDSDSYVLETQIICYHLASLHRWVHYSVVRYVYSFRPRLCYSCSTDFALTEVRSYCHETYSLSTWTWLKMKFWQLFFSINPAFYLPTNCYSSSPVCQTCYHSHLPKFASFWNCFQH